MSGLVSIIPVLHMTCILPHFQTDFSIPDYYQIEILSTLRGTGRKTFSLVDEFLGKL